MTHDLPLRLPPGGTRARGPAPVPRGGELLRPGLGAGRLSRGRQGGHGAVPTPSGSHRFRVGGGRGDGGQARFWRLRAELGDIPMVLGSSTGVLTERAEHEGGSAVSGSSGSGGTATPLFVPPKTAADEIGRRSRSRWPPPSVTRRARSCSCAQPKASPLTRSTSWPASAAAPTVIGGGTLPGGAWIAAPDRKSRARRRGGARRPRHRTPRRPHLGGVPPSRPVSPITEARGAMVFRLGDKPALEALSACTRDLARRPLVLAVIAHPEDDGGAPRRTPGARHSRHRSARARRSSSPTKRRPGCS